MQSWRVDDEMLAQIAELMRLGVGRAASALSDLLEEQIELDVDSLHIGSPEEGRVGISVPNSLSDTLITQSFDGPIRGRASLCFSAANGVTLAQRLSNGTFETPAELDVELRGVLLEVGNIVLNGVMGAFGNALSTSLIYSIPELQTANRRGDSLLQGAVGEDDALVSGVCFRVLQLQIEGLIVIVFAAGSIHAIQQALLHPAT